MRNIHSTVVSALTGVVFLAAAVSRLQASCVLDGSFNPAGSFSSGSTVFAIGVQSDGKVLFGGYFTYNGNYPNGYPFTANNLVRFNANGTVDTSYNPAPNSTVRALLVQPDDKVIIGGSFTQVSGLTQTYISRLTTATGYPDYIGFQAPVPNNYVTALGRRSDGTIVVGGPFTTMAGFTYSHLACLKVTGGLISTFNPGVYGGASATVWAIAVYPTGTPSADKVLVGGDFTSAGGYSRVNLVQLNSSGSVDTGFTPASINGVVYALGTDYGTFTTSGPGGSNVEKVYIGGAFTSPRNYFTRLASTGSADNNIENQVTDGTVKSIRVQANHGIIIGGSFANAQSTARGGIARFYAGANEDGTWVNDLLHLSAWADCSPSGAGGGSVEAVALNSLGGAYVGGSFTTVEGSTRPKVAGLSPTP